MTVADNNIIIGYLLGGRMYVIMLTYSLLFVRSG